MPEPELALSEEGQRERFCISTGPDGPFWEAVRPRPSGLILALSSPHGLPFGPIDWTESKIRVWDGSASKDLPILENLESEDFYGLIVKPITGDRLRLPDDIKGSVKGSLSFDWTLWIDSLPPTAHRYEPYFFEGNREEQTWVWSAEFPAEKRRALLPYQADLVWSVDLRSFGFHGSAPMHWRQQDAAGTSQEIRVRLMNSDTGKSSRSMQRSDGAGNQVEQIRALKARSEQRRRKVITPPPN